MRAARLLGLSAFCRRRRDFVLSEILQDEFLDVRLVGEDVARDFLGEAQGIERRDSAAEFNDGA